MTAVIVIPARFRSSRFPGKPLTMLKGCDGRERSLIRRTWEAARAVAGVAEVVVATDDDRIRDHVLAFGAQVMMTAGTCRNGTERCAEAAARLGKDVDIVINVQGDSPLVPHWIVESLVDALDRNTAADVATPVLRCDAATHGRLLRDRREGRVGATTAAFDVRNRALYFSKEVIPHAGREFAEGEPVPVFHHLGVYAYRRDAVRRYAAWPAGPLETAEGLEQLRFLENGATVLCVEADARGRSFWEVNNPVDVARVESILEAEGTP